MSHHLLFQLRHLEPLKAQKRNRRGKDRQFSELWTNCHRALKINKSSRAIPWKRWTKLRSPKTRSQPAQTRCPHECPRAPKWWLPLEFKLMNSQSKKRLTVAKPSNLSLSPMRTALSKMRRALEKNLSTPANSCTATALQSKNWSLKSSLKKIR